MATYHTIELSGTEKSLADWGVALDSPQGDFRNAVADTLRLAIAGQLVTSAPVFPFEATIIFRLDRDSVDGAPNTFSGGSVEFIGKRVSNPLDLRPEWEGVQYQFLNAWYDLEHTIYQQEFATWSVGHAQGLTFQSEVVLFTRLDPQLGLAPITNGEQIQDTLQFLLDQYTDQGMAAPYIIGQIDPDVPVPSYIGKPMSCADVIVKSLEISPDCKVFFDYTTQIAGVPTPTIHVRRQSGLQAAALPIKDGVNHKELHLVPRPDLQARAVVVRYKITDVYNGQSQVRYLEDKYGPNGQDNAADPDSGLRVIVESLDMVGVQVNTISAPLETKLLECVGGSHAARRAWWADHDTQFAGSRLRFQDQAGAATVLPDATVVDAETGDSVNLSVFYNEVVDGMVHPWMRYNGAQVLAKRVRITSAMTYAQYDVDATGGSDTAANGRLLKRYSAKEHHIELTLTNGITETYYSTETTAAEPVPVGLAQKIYESLATLQYEGEYIRVEASVSGGVTMANTVNLTNGRTEWATMRAQIQGLRKHYGLGYTEVTIGPARHLSAGELLSILRFWRFRYQRFDIYSRATGIVSGSEVGMTQNAPKRNTTPGLDVPTFNTVSSVPDANGQSVSMTQDADNKQFLMQRVVVATGAPVVTAPKVLIKHDDIPDVAAGQAQPIAKLRKCSLMVDGALKDVYVLATDAFSGGGGGSYEEDYDPTKTYQKGAIVRVRSGTSAGVWIARTLVPAGSAPVFPEPETNRKWDLIAFGPLITSVCSNGSKTVYMNATQPI